MFLNLAMSLYLKNKSPPRGKVECRHFHRLTRVCNRAVDPHSFFANPDPALENCGVTLNFICNYYPVTISMNFSCILIFPSWIQIFPIFLYFILRDSVSDPYSLNPDPAKNLNPDPDPDPGKFFSPT